MNADRLLAHYERIADAPDAIPRARRFILDLAVRGKLVPQDPNDEPASELLKRNAATKARLVETVATRTRRSPKLPQANDEDLPFALPIGWTWARFCDVASIQSNLVDPRGYKSYPHIAPDNIESRTGRLLPYETIGDSGVFSSKHLFRAGCLLYSKIRPALAKVTLADFDGLCSADMYPLRPSIDRRYLQTFMLAEVFVRQSVTEDNRVAMPKINQESLAKILVAVPPLAEQGRIVAKVDELMALCDQLETARAEREATRDRLAAATLAHLNAPDSDMFQDDARFALDSLTALTTRPDQIKQLRQTILNFAVNGQLSTEGPWRSTPVKLGDVATLQNGYAFKSEWFSSSGTRLLRNANVAHGVLDWTDEVHLPESWMQEYERFHLTEGDVVLSLDRPFIVTGTKVARVRANDLPSLLLQRVGRFVLSDSIDSDYLFLWINSPHFSGQINPGRSNGVPHISSKQVEAAVLFVPPLAEQHCIVAKVDELMALCDRLEASLDNGDNARLRLLDTLLAEALAPTTLEAA